MIIKFSKHRSKLSKKCRFKGCVFPDKSQCSKKIIKAHSIQMNKILNLIADNGMVVFFDGSRSIITNDFEEIGIKQASTFFGFCNHHDTTVFSNIENVDYYDTKEQNFLYAYRACAREFVVKYEATCIHQQTASLYRLYPDYITQLYYNLESSRQGLVDVQNHINKFSTELVKSPVDRNYYLLSTAVFKLQYEAPIAVNSIFNLIYDFHGNVINNLSNFSKNVAPLFLNIFPQSGKTILLLSCFTSDLNRYNNFFSELNNLTNSELERVFSQIVLTYCENFFVSPRKWNTHSKNERGLIVEYFNKTMMGPPDRNYLTSRAITNLFQVP